MKVFLFVNESMGKRIFNKLTSEKLKITGVFSDKKSKDYNFYKNKSNELKFKLFYNLEKQYVKIKEHLISEKIDVMINIFSYSKIPNELINLVRIGAFNLHPGKLPQYAGLNPISWSLHNGEKHHHITLHWMTDRIDSGPIVVSKSFKIHEKDSAIDLMKKSIKYGEKLIFQFLKNIKKNNKKIPKINQNLKKRKYNSNQIPNSGFINWSTKASQIHNFVRAFDYKPYISFWLEPKAINKKNIYYVIKVKKTNIKCKAKPGNIFFYKKKYMHVSTLDFWIAILKIKYKNKYINPIQFFNNQDKFRIIN